MIILNLIQMIKNWPDEIRTAVLLSEAMGIPLEEVYWRSNLHYVFYDPHCDQADIDLLLQPCCVEEQQSWTLIQEHWTLANIMTLAGVFPSTSQARKAGWNRSIRVGFDRIVIGKKWPKYIYTLTPMIKIA